MILLFFSAFISELNALYYISYKYFWSKRIVIKDSILNQLWWYKRYFLPFKYFLQFALISASYKTPWRPLMKMKAPSLGSELSSASSTSSSSSSFRSSSSTSSSPWSSSPSTSLARRSLRTTWTRTKSLALTLLLGQGKARSPQVLLNSFFTWTPQMQDHDDTLLQASWTLCAWWDFRAKVENIIFVKRSEKEILFVLSERSNTTKCCFAGFKCGVWSRRLLLKIWSCFSSLWTPSR